MRNEVGEEEGALQWEDQLETSAATWSPREGRSPGEAMNCPCCRPRHNTVILHTDAAGFPLSKQHAIGTRDLRSALISAKQPHHDDEVRTKRI